MKKQIVVIVIGGILMGAGSSVYAQGAGTYSDSMTPAVPQSAPATTTLGAPEPGAVPVSAKEAKKIKLQKAVSKLENSLQMRITSLESIAINIQTRIGKIQQEGKDMSAASAKLVVAQKAIAEASAALKTMQTANIEMIASAKPAVAFVTIKNKLAKNITIKIKAAHKALVETVVIIKGQSAAVMTKPTTATSSTSTVQ